MESKHQAPRFDRYRPASENASKAKRGTPRRDTRAEMQLRRALWHRGVRYRLHAKDLPGKPDLVFRGARLVVFVDGDFWHGRDWESQRQKLATRRNADYWIAKIEYNRGRDQRNTALLEADGWCVLRFWETDIQADVEAAVRAVLVVLNSAPGRNVIESKKDAFAAHLRQNHTTDQRGAASFGNVDRWSPRTICGA